MGQYGDSYVYGPYEYCLQNRPPPPATVWNCWGGCFLHGYVTVYVSYYHFSVVVSYYYSIVIIDID